MNLLTPEQQRIMSARSTAGAILKMLGLTPKQRRDWLDRHIDTPPDQLAETARREFRKNGGAK